MCDTCGCNEGGGYTITNCSGHSHQHDHSHDDHHGHDHSHNDHDHPHSHNHPHPHDHAHDHGHDQHIRVPVEADIMQYNNMLAERNRGFFEARSIVCLNLVSSPGSGKTTILEKTISLLGSNGVFVIEGDQQTVLDANRIAATGAVVVQVNTGNGCHLDAEMINKAVKTMNPGEYSLLLIENVGNLVCPALFDLGEKKRVVIMSVTEGEDKPLKYPNMFQTAHLCLINKTDLLPYVDFNMENFRSNARKVNPHIEFIALSAKTSEGMIDWKDWLNKQRDYSLGD